MLLHGTRRVILMLHSDCGAYGGLVGPVRRRSGGGARFITARNCGGQRTIWSGPYPGLEMDSYFVDFEGVWEPNPALASTAAV